MSRETGIASQLLAIVGAHNVAQATSCMTRLRLDPHRADSVDQAALRKVDGVKGVVQTGSQIQIILGPGLAEKVTVEFNRLVATGDGFTAAQAPNPAAMAPAQTMDSGRGGFKDFLRRLANVFLPLIPAIIGSGMIAAITNFLIRLGVPNDYAIGPVAIMPVLNYVGFAIFGFLHILVGMNAAREWGGPPIIGAVAGALLIGPGLTALEMVPGRGGLLGALIAGAFLGWLYRRVSKFMPDTVNVIFSPTLTILLGGLVILYVVQPVGFWISSGVVAAAQGLLTLGGIAGNIVSGGLLAGFFLPLVMTGLHQGLTPIHAELIEQLGNTPLLPILAMAGAGQVGAAIAVYMRTRDKELRQIITGALPVGMLGIGEPLIFGVTLPLGRPFVAACLGGAIGGAFIATTHIGTIGLGISGIPLAFLATNPLIYLLGLVIAYVAGFGFTLALGFDESLAAGSKAVNFGA